MAEFALLLPLLALLLVMAVDVGRVFFGWVGVQNAARIAANYAAQHPLDDYAESTTASSDFQAYQDEVDADTAGIDCNLPTPLPAPTFPGGTAPGSDAVVAITCDFTPITPLASVFVGSPLTIAAESTFPIRTGNVGGPGGGGGPPADPLCRTVPDMEAMTVANARTAWSFAGFSGIFSPAAGDDDQIVVSQVTNPASVPGECITFAATVGVTHKRLADMRRGRGNRPEPGRTERGRRAAHLGCERFRHGELRARLRIGRPGRDRADDDTGLAGR